MTEIEKKAQAFDLLVELMQFGDMEDRTPANLVTLMYDEIVDAKIAIAVSEAIAEVQKEVN